MRIRSRFILIAGFCGLAVVALCLFILRPRGVEAVVRNADTTTMHDVTVSVTGRSYALGDIPAGEVRSVRVRPTGESDLAIAYADRGETKSIMVGCYIEAGYSGSITVDVANGGVVKKVDRIDY